MRNMRSPKSELNLDREKEELAAADNDVGTRRKAGAIDPAGVTAHQGISGHSVQGPGEGGWNFSAKNQNLGSGLPVERKSDRF